MSFELPDPHRDEDATNICPRPASSDTQIAAYPHRSERIRKAFGFSRFRWYVIAPVEYHVRYLLWRLTEGRNA